MEEPLLLFHLSISIGGHFLLMDSSYATYGSWARLRSRLFSPTDHAELEYSYYMSGKSVNALKVYIVVNGFKNLLHAFVGDQGDEWLVDHLDIRSQFPYRVSNYCLPIIGILYLATYI